MFDLAGKTVLVAGGAGYLGAPICTLVARQGARVCVADIDANRLKSTVAEIASTGADVWGLPLDIGDEASVLACVRDCVARAGSLWGVVNATFGSTGKKFDDLTAADFDRANRLNLTGSFILAREAALHMKDGGSMVMFASMYGLVAPKPAIYPPPMAPNPIEYGAGKAGLVQMVRYMAGHFGPRGIRVNAIAPGPFPHDKTVADAPEFARTLASSTMLGRIGRQAETAGPTAFLLSEASSYVTGQVLPVDGGWTSW
ncbi:MAG: SDR family oxidoreductase [Devosia nanyangense]|nr:SDR family oxidoreductase [Devosia nanyangense]